MKKSTTKKSHFEQINLALVYIHDNFDSNITAEDLAQVSGYSVYHFHRIFKEIIGENINDYIRNTRLEKASNILLYNQHKNIETIAQDCGFSTSTGFSAAFKKRFNLTPKQWRKGGYENPSKLKNSEYSLIEVDEDMDIGTPQIISKEDLPIMYTRVYGYESDMSEVWQNMKEWCEEIGVLDEPHKYIGLFHNHPSFAPYNTARYLACIQTQSELIKSGKVGKCVITNGKFAKFEFTCTHNDLYKLMHLAYMNWLPNSNYEVRNFPAYVEYKNPENLLTNGILEVDFYMPIQLII